MDKLVAHPNKKRTIIKNVIVLQSFTFTFMHFAYAFFQSYLYFISTCVALELDPHPLRY